MVGLLAGISVVAYSGIQGRARYAQLLAAVDAAQKAILLYHSQYGEFPATEDDLGNSLLEGGAYYACLGQSSDYPARNGFRAGECYGHASVTDGIYSSLIMQKIDSLSPGLHVDTTNFINVPGGGRARGIHYMGTTTDASIIYHEVGNVNCGRGEKQFFAPDSTTPPQGLTMCEIAL